MKKILPIIVLSILFAGCSWSWDRPTQTTTITDNEVMEVTPEPTETVEEKTGNYLPSQAVNNTTVSDKTGSSLPEQNNTTTTEVNNSVDTEEMTKELDDLINEIVNL